MPEWSYFIYVISYTFCGMFFRFSGLSHLILLTFITVCYIYRIPYHDQGAAKFYLAAISLAYLVIPTFIRKLWLTRIILWYNKYCRIPNITELEQKTIYSSDIWWEGEVLRGIPMWDKLHSIKPSILSNAEAVFIDNQLKELLTLLSQTNNPENNDDQQNINGLTKETWSFLTTEKFFGLQIPKQYGGLEFSAYAKAIIMESIAENNLIAAMIILSCNNILPAKILLQHGTIKQKNKYLNKLSSGEEIVCCIFPELSLGKQQYEITETGIICNGEFHGHLGIGIKINWQTRYVHLSPIATSICIAIKVSDPDNLLGLKYELGTLICLFPSNLPGISVGQEHTPMDIKIYNAPIQGTDVFVPLEFVIGDPQQLDNGEDIINTISNLAYTKYNIPTTAINHAAANLCARSAKLYYQTEPNEKIQKSLGEINGYIYLMRSLSNFTITALDQDLCLPTISAIHNYHVSNFSTIIANLMLNLPTKHATILDAHNKLTTIYKILPINQIIAGSSISNIYLNVFKQYLLTCHPAELNKILAIHNNDLEKFDIAINTHFQNFFCNLSNYIINLPTNFYLSGNAFSGTKFMSKIASINRLSLIFAILIDLILIYFKNNLDKHHSVYNQLCDALSYLFMASSVIEYHKSNEASKEEHDYFLWSINYCLYHAEQKIYECIQSLPNGFFKFICQNLLFPFGRKYQTVSEALTFKIAT